MSENIKSSIFDFIRNNPRVKCPDLKYCVVNKHLPRQDGHQNISFVRSSKQCVYRGN